MEYLITVVVILLAVLSGLAIGNWIRSRMAGTGKRPKGPGK
ncbi:MAG: hypothetical protein ACM3ON_03840 [Chloroflexota bacterium]